MIKLLAATETGLVICEREGQEWRNVAVGLTEHHLTAVIAR